MIPLMASDRLAFCINLNHESGFFGALIYCACARTAGVVITFRAYCACVKGMCARGKDILIAP